MRTPLHHAILRLAPVYGPDFRLNLDKRLYLKPPSVGYYLGNGSYRLSLCSIQNVVSIREWLDGERQRGRCSVALRLPYSLCLAGAAAMEALVAATGRQPGMLTVGNVKKLARSTIWDNSRARGIVGSLPGHVPPEG